MNTQNIAENKSKLFALRVIKLYKYLCESKNEYILSKQLLRSGTSIGANVKEAERGQSKADFYAKMNIALKEAAETEYWLELFEKTNIITNNQFKTLKNNCGKIRKLLIASINTAKSNS